ncbi:hypothetical protein PMIN03_012744 [Paraphaeosphaeria minitans]
MSMFRSLQKRPSRRGSAPLSPKSVEANTTQRGYLIPGNGNSPTNPSPATRRPSNLYTNPFARSGANDPPPAYSPGPAALTSTSRQPPMGPATDDDPYAFLRNFDTIFLIDDSGSMAGSRWSQVEQALTVIAPICAERDEDGIDVYMDDGGFVFPFWISSRSLHRPERRVGVTSQSTLPGRFARPFIGTLSCKETWNRL